MPETGQIVRQTDKVLGGVNNGKGIESFPNNKAIQTFYSMTLYNLNEHSLAMELLLKCLIDTTADDEILSYKNAIDFYSNKLDEIWE